VIPGCCESRRTRTYVSDVGVRVVWWLRGETQAGRESLGTLWPARVRRRGAVGDSAGGRSSIMAQFPFGLAIGFAAAGNRDQELGRVP
jgi:hypothetical protein